MKLFSRIIKVPTWCAILSTSRVPMSDGDAFSRDVFFNILLGLDIGHGFDVLLSLNFIHPVIHPSRSVRYIPNYRLFDAPSAASSSFVDHRALPLIES